jgi:[ribosomal protein S5]-alanine N-acetyltransferase
MRALASFATGRLKARPLTPGDLDELVILYQSPLVIETLGVARPREHIIQSLKGDLDHWDIHDFGYYIFEDKETGAFIGRGGLQYSVVDGIKEVEIAYAFMPEYCQQALVDEIVQKLIRMGFQSLKLSSLVTLILPDNISSKEVVEKNGFIFEKEVMHKGLPHFLYRLVLVSLKRAEG